MLYSWLSNTLSSLGNRAKQNRLHHALLFIGDKGIGLGNLSDNLSATLLCQNQQIQACNNCKSCLLFSKGSHPDFNSLIREKTQIGVDLVRQGIEKLSTKSQFLGNKVLVIEEADKLTESAANALLKTLEEPTENTYILLTTSNKQALLPTILSRCEHHIIRSPSREQSIDYFLQNNITPPSDLDFAACAYSPLLYELALEQDEIRYFHAFIEQFKALQQCKISPSALAHQWESKAEQVTIWLARILSERTSPIPQFDAYEAVLEARKKCVHPGLNKQLILSTLFIHIIKSKIEV